MEKAFLHGQSYETTDANGKPLRFTEGLIPSIRAYGESDNISDFLSNTDVRYAGKEWIDAGEEWMDETLSYIFKYGSNSKLAFCGTGAISGINRLAKANGFIQLKPTDAQYGLKVVEWLTSFGVIHLLRHPLMSYEATDRNAMVIFEADKLTYCHPRGRDTKLLKNRQSPGADAQVDEYLTECGLEYHHPEVCGYMTGVGQDNTQ